MRDLWRWRSKASSAATAVNLTRADPAERAAPVSTLFAIFPATNSSVIACLQ